MNEIKVGEMIKIDWRFYHFFAGFKKTKLYNGDDYFLVRKKTKKYLYFEGFSEGGGFNERSVKFKATVSVFEEMTDLIPSFYETVPTEKRNRVLKSVFNLLLENKKKGRCVYNIDKKISTIADIMLELDLYHNDVAKVLLTT